jgi:carbon-monoxide dehydrogenase medium subunit
LRPRGSSAYAKVERRAGDWAVVAAGAAVWLVGDVIADARVGLAAVGPNTTGIPQISEALRGRTPSEELWAEAGRIAAESCTPITDGRGSADYKRHLAAELTRRTLRTAAERIVR